METNFPLSTTNQKHYPELVVTSHQHGISTVILQTWPPLQASALILVIATLFYPLKKDSDAWLSKRRSFPGNKRCHQTQIISLACVSSRAHNLQCIFHGGGGGWGGWGEEGWGRSLTYAIIGMGGGKGYGFWLFRSEMGYQFQPFLSEIGYSLCTQVLNWVCFLEEATSSSFGNKTISLLMFTPTMYMP